MDFDVSVAAVVSVACEWSHCSGKEKGRGAAGERTREREIEGGFDLLERERKRERDAESVDGKLLDGSRRHTCQRAPRRQRQHDDGPPRSCVEGHGLSCYQKEKKGRCSPSTGKAKEKSKSKVRESVIF
jgi:hypothetical protein